METPPFRPKQTAEVEALRKQDHTIPINHVERRSAVEGTPSAKTLRHPPSVSIILSNHARQRKLPVKTDAACAFLVSKPAPRVCLRVKPTTARALFWLLRHTRGVLFGTGARYPNTAEKPSELRELLRWLEPSYSLQGTAGAQQGARRAAFLTPRPGPRSGRQRSR